MSRSPFLVRLCLLDLLRFQLPILAHHQHNGDGVGVDGDQVRWYGKFRVTVLLEREVQLVIKKTADLVCFAFQKWSEYWGGGRSYLPPELSSLPSSWQISEETTSTLSKNTLQKTKVEMTTSFQTILDSLQLLVKRFKQQCNWSNKSKVEANLVLWCREFENLIWSESGWELMC